MSLFLRFACVKCPIRTVSYLRRFYWTSQGFTIREGLGIRFFFPRTSDVPDYASEQRPGDRFVSKEYKTIYSLTDESILRSFTYGAYCFAFVILYLLCSPERMKQLKECMEGTGKDESISKELTLEDDYVPGTATEKVKKFFDGFLETAHSGDPRARLLVALAMVIMFFYVRSRCVLTIYRSNNEFITVFYKFLSLQKKPVEHRANDCCYYPKRKLFNHNLMGRNIIIFPELFVNEKEKEMYIGKGG